MLAMKFNDKLAHLLDTMHWPQSRLRDALSSPVGQATVHAWVSGKGPLPRADQALEIAKALGVDVEWLIDDTQEMPPRFPAASSPDLDEKEREILKIAKLLGYDRAMGRLLGIPRSDDFGPLPNSR